MLSLAPVCCFTSLSLSSVCSGGNTSLFSPLFDDQRLRMDIRLSSHHQVKRQIDKRYRVVRKASLQGLRREPNDSTALALRVYNGCLFLHIPLPSISRSSTHIHRIAWTFLFTMNKPMTWRPVHWGCSIGDDPRQVPDGHSLQELTRGWDLGMGRLVFSSMNCVSFLKKCSYDLATGKAFYVE